MSTTVYDEGEGYCPGDPLEFNEDIDKLVEQVKDIQDIENPVLRLEKATEWAENLNG